MKTSLASTYEAVPCVLTIGNFDGVHRGHQTLISKAQERAKALDLQAFLLTFDPHPQAFFKPENAFFQLSENNIKNRLLHHFGLNGLIICDFDHHFAETSAENFIIYLKKRLLAKCLVVGDNFHFGKARHGTPQLLIELCKHYNLELNLISPVLENGVVVSSSAIRQALQRGDIAQANKMLGYNWIVSGKVIHGEKRGRELGFPTANLQLNPNCALRFGIYGVRVRVQGSIYEGVASFGRRPVFDNGAPLLEVFLFNFQGDLYDQYLDIEYVGWIREEKHFQSVGDLIIQMNEDVKVAQNIFSHTLPFTHSLLPQLSYAQTMKSGNQTIITDAVFTSSSVGEVDT